MNESFSQPNQEKNLALERQEAVKLHNEILKKQESLPDTEKQEATDKVAEMSTLREKVGNIDKYKDLAKPFNDQYYYRVGDISSVGKLNKEKERIDTEVEKVKSVIEETANKLNELREKLGMEPTTDIPSLDIKKERLPYLLKIQSDLENKLNFETKKQKSLKEETTENSKREGRNVTEGLEDISSNIKKIASMLDERQSSGYNSIFNDEDGFRSVASKIDGSSNKEEIKNNLTRLGSIVDDFADNRGRGVNDDTENLYSMVGKLRYLASALQELPQKLQNEEERKELAQIAGSVAEKVDTAASRITRKAQAIEEFLR